MDIRVGGPPPLGSPASSETTRQEPVEARVLSVRAPRRRKGSPRPKDRERRTDPQPRDPLGGRVVVLLVPDGSQIPADAADGDYRVILRFVRR
ncbi:MAG: hypothetical protein GY716_08410 [bacterium]|nr:hypothetical protein [bacterium]